MFLAQVKIVFYKMPVCAQSEVALVSSVAMTLRLLIILGAVAAALNAPSLDSHYVDNSDLPVSDRMAVFFTGLYKHEGNITQRSLASVLEFVVKGYGGPVDIFVDMFPKPDGPTVEEVVQELKELVPHSLKTVILQPSVRHELGPLDSVELSKEYGHDTAMISQFSRLSRLYPEVLASEVLLRERYRYMARVRSDTIFSRPWMSVTDLKTSSSLDSVIVQVWNADHIWLAGRNVAPQMFQTFPNLFYRPHLKAPIAAAVGTGMYDAVWGEFAIWPEAILSWWLQKGLQGANVQQRCEVFGPFTIHGSHSELTHC